MDALFRPQSIAIAGASQSEGKLGNIIVKRILADYQGRVFPINPNATTIAEIQAYKDISTLPQNVDLLIALLPGASLLPLIDSCTYGQVKFLLAIPSGFGEVSSDGKELQNKIVATALERGMRVVGPNCMGLLNGVDSLNASLAPDMPPTGVGFSFLTQSGGLAIAATMYALDHQLPIAKICDLGNTADIQAWEVMHYLKDDPDTSVVGVLLECAGSEEKFIPALSKLASAKPTIVTLLGRTQAGQRASQAHLGLTSDPALISRIGTTGAIYTDTGRGLFNLAKSLTWQPRPAGKRVAIMTGTGGVGTELADLAVENGLDVPEFSDPVREELAQILPSYAGFANPVDMTPIWWQYPEVYPAVLNALLNASNIDSVIVTITDVACGIEPLAAALVKLEKARTQVGSAVKPIFVYWGARDNMLSNMQILERAKIPCLRTTRETIETVAALAQPVRPDSEGSSRG